MTWDADTLAAIAAADDLHIAPFREDGKTPGTFTWIWSVVVDGNLYVRAWNGVQSRWHQAALAQRAGKIRATGKTFNVTFTPADASLGDAVDAAYQRKYAGSAYLPPMVGERTRAATVRIDPREG